MGNTSYHKNWQSACPLKQKCLNCSSQLMSKAISPCSASQFSAGSEIRSRDGLYHVLRANKWLVVSNFLLLPSQKQDVGPDGYLSQQQLWFDTASVHCQTKAGSRSWRNGCAGGFGLSCVMISKILFKKYCSEGNLLAYLPSFILEQHTYSHITLCPIPQNVKVQGKG